MSDAASWAEQRRLEELTRPSHSQEAGPPPGWRPGVQLTAGVGDITTRPGPGRDPRWDDQLRDWGYDPAEYEVCEPISVATWEGYIKNAEGHIEKTQLWSHRGRIRRRQDRLAVEDLVASIGQHCAERRSTGAKPPVTFVAAIADMQLGKSEGGGSPATVGRVEAALAMAKTRLRSLGRRYSVEGVAILNAGDPIENTCGWYPSQLWEIDLDRRDQVKVAARLMTASIETFTGHPVTAAWCDSNHGENRQANRLGPTTGAHDSADLEIAERVGEAYALAKRDDVTFVIPQLGYVTTLRLSGVNLALAHGHRAPKGVPSDQKQWEWWKGQDFGGLPAGDAQILVTGHYHHLRAVAQYGRSWLQCPSLDGGSDWLTRVTGHHCPPGLLTFLVGAHLGPLGWAELEVMWP